MKKQFQKPLLLIMYGYPGAGKSSFARQFAHEYRMLHISADRIRYELFDDPLFNSAEDQVITALMDYMAEQAFKSGTSCVYDKGLGVRKQRQNLVEAALKYNVASLVVWCQTDKETAQYRSRNRDRRKAEDRYSFPVELELFEREMSRMTNPGDKEEYIVVSGKHPYRSQARAVINRLLRLGVYTTDSIASAEQAKGRVDPSIRRLRPQDVGRGTHQA